MDLTLAERSRLDFVLSLRRRWADTVYPALREQFEHDAERAADIRASVQRQPAYPWFAFLERNAQKMLWRDVTDIVAAHPAAAPEPADAPATLKLNPGLTLPDWYTDWDIHIQPGGIWRNAASAEVYELGAKLVMLGGNDDYTFHRAFVETAIPNRPYRRMVDLGCGFGKSTWPLKRSFPDAEVIGIDLAEPCLRKAQQRANAAGLAIEFVPSRLPGDQLARRLRGPRYIHHADPRDAPPGAGGHAARMPAHPGPGRPSAVPRLHPHR